MTNSNAYWSEATGSLRFKEPLKASELPAAKKKLREVLEHAKWFHLDSEGISIHRIVTLEDNIELEIKKISLNFEVEGATVMVGENPGDVWRIVVRQEDPKFIVERAKLTWPDGTEF